jgi:transketolase
MPALFRPLPVFSSNTVNDRTISTVDLARRIRRRALECVYRAQTSHIGSCLSMADILAVLYGRVLRVDPQAPSAADRDRFILSKGHGAAGLYGTLAETGFFDAELLKTYCEDGSILMGHVSHAVPGIEASTGSLGHGLPLGCGLALAAARTGRPYCTFVLLSDGELDEGSNWEAALFAGHHRLAQLTAVVDCNGIQSYGTVAEVLDLEPLADKWRAFRWNVVEVPGHDHAALVAAFETAAVETSRPTVVLARTVKGKGVSFMEDRLLWHYRSPDAGELQRAFAELEVGP